MKFYRYTDKAIANPPIGSTTCDKNRLMLVDDEKSSRLGKGQFAAWKFDVTSHGLQGPLPQPIPPSELREAMLPIYISAARKKGSSPTAVVTLDSYHEEVPYPVVFNMVRNAYKNPWTPPPTAKAVAEQKKVKKAKAKSKLVKRVPIPKGVAPLPGGMESVHSYLDEVARILVTARGAIMDAANILGSIRLTLQPSAPSVVQPTTNVTN